MMNENTTTHRRTTNSSGDATAPSPPPSGVARAPGGGIGAGSPLAALLLPFKILSRAPAIVAILLRVALWPAFKIANAAFPPKDCDGVNNSTASDRAARAFVAMFQRQISIARPAASARGSAGGEGDRAEHYVDPACPFSPRGYRATLSDIAARPPAARPLLLLYLHSPLLADGTRFVRDYLCSPQLLQLLNSNGTDGGGGSVVCFGANVHAADGQMLRDMMGVTSFPFLALLSVKSPSGALSDREASVSMELVLRMEGMQLLKIPPAQITTYLNTSITRHAESLAAEEARRLQREEEQRLREEQDREYQEALLADQMREIERQEVEERERREREGRDEEERLRKAREESRLVDAKALLDAAGGEPPAGAKGVARLRFTLPNGKRVDRRFRSADTIETIRAFLAVHFDEHDIEMKNFGLSTNYPRKTFQEEDDKLTLEETGLAPQAVIMVQDLDS